MNGKQLRNSILQWAIQGKLVPQDPNDEPASVLLERIRAEKKRLVKEGKIKKDKNESIIYKGDDNSYYEKFLDGKVVCIDEEIPFEIPQGWEWARLDNICELIEDCPHSTARDEGVGYPLIRTSNVGFGVLNLDNVHRVCREIYNKRNKRAVPQPNDLIFAREAPAGNIAVIQENENVCLGQRTVLLRPFVKYVNPYYLAYFILSPISQRTLVNDSTGTTVSHVNLSDFRPYIIALPPITEQLQIVAKIKEVLPLVSRYEKIQGALDELNDVIFDKIKKTILQDAIQGWPNCPFVFEKCHDSTDEPASALLEKIAAEKQQLVKEGKIKAKEAVSSIIFKGDDSKYYEKTGKNIVDITEEIPFELPESWAWSRLKNIVIFNPKNVASDNAVAAFMPMNYINPGYGSGYKYDEIQWGKIKKGFSHFANGDIAFAKITPCFQNRKSFIANNLPSNIGAGTTELVVLRPYGNTLYREYVLFFLQSSYFVEEAKFKGTAGQQRIMAGYSENKLLPLPPYEEQIRISRKINELLASIMSR